jgi:hypothetical protein
MTTGASGHCHAGALARLDELIGERVKQLDRFTLRLTESLERAQTEHPDGLPTAPFVLHEQFIAEWPDLKPKVNVDSTHPGDEAKRDAFLEKVGADGPYLDAVKELSEGARSTGTEWLQGIVDEVTNGSLGELALPDRR